MKVCSKCKKPLGENDKYCKHCGQKRREVEYDPNARSVYGRRGGGFMNALYGPPYSAKYVCPKCGNVYIERGLGAPSERYCTECGAKYELKSGGRFGDEE